MYCPCDCRDIGILAYTLLYFFQASVLVYYTTVCGNGWWGFSILLYLPSYIYLCGRHWCQSSDYRRYTVHKIWRVWLAYVVALIVSIIVIFRNADTKLKSTDTWGPNALKTILCITPALLILLLNTVFPPGKQTLVQKIAFAAAIDLFDGIEMLEIALMKIDRAGSDDLKYCIIGFVSATFLFSPLNLWQYKRHNKHSKGALEIKTSKRRLALRTFLQVLCCNLPYLAVRFYVWASYGFDASIFITKNILAILLSAVDLCAVLNEKYTFEIHYV